jgi:hypothetical protein
MVASSLECQSNVDMVEALNFDGFFAFTVSHALRYLRMEMLIAFKRAPRAELRKVWPPVLLLEHVF